MIRRRALLAAPVAAALPRFAIAQPERPALTVAVAKISNTGTLDPLREQSSNASEHWMGLILETPIGRDQQHGLERVPGLATAWRRIDDRTLELELRPGVIMHDGRTLTADDVASASAPACSGPSRACRPTSRPIARRHWPALERVEATGPLTLRLVNRTPDVTLEGRLAAGGSEVVSAASYGNWAASPSARSAPAPTKSPSSARTPRSPSRRTTPTGAAARRYRTVRFLEVPEPAARVDGLLSGQYGLAADISPDQIATVEARQALRQWSAASCRTTASSPSTSTTPPCADPRVRLAMAHAIDGQAIVDALWAGRSRVPPGLQWEFYGPMFVQGWTVPPYDPARAKSLLHDAGYKGDADPLPYPQQLLHRRDPHRAGARRDVARRRPQCRRSR